MRTIQTANLLILMLLASVFITSAGDLDVRKEKEYDKQFKVNKSTVVKIKNKFGKVNIVPWSENYVKIDVQVVVEARSDDKANQLLDKIEIDFIGSDNSSEVGAITEMRGSINTSKNERFEINYEVKVPASQPMDISHQFGTIVSGNLTGKIEISHQHGNAMLGDILGNDSKIKMQFGDLDVGKMSNAEINIQHCGNVTIEKAENIILNSQHSKIAFGEVKNVEIELQHGQFKSDKLASIEGDIQFSKFEVGTLTGKLDLDVQHTGSFEIEKVASSVSNINLDVQFSSPKLRFENISAWDMEIEVNHGGVSHPSDFSFNYVDKKTTSATYRKNGNSGKKLTVDGQFSSVTIK
ncbi:hypothetical protein [Marinigracilibium pacificum]|uniref:Adhesin n=1 Tax=Marinigracilibium pacificum TaxID=2729599 RepID=A0A848J4D8_9BACT|nr:hypothetical protein [Marinigracilibium pacificum]NMM50611.1 hypothetical protein [Marinigracilibium pacificum]